MGLTAVPLHEVLLDNVPLGSHSPRSERVQSTGRITNIAHK